MKSKTILKKEKQSKRQSRNKKGKISGKLKSGDNSSSNESDIYFYNDLQRWKNNIKVPIWLKKPKDRESLSEYYKNIIRKLLRVKNKIRAYKIQEAYLIDCLHKCMKYLKLNSLSMDFLDYEIYKNLIYNDNAENLYDSLNHFYEHDNNNIENGKNECEKFSKENLNDCKKRLKPDIKKNNNTSSGQIVYQNNDNPNIYEADKNGAININRDYIDYKIDMRTKCVKNSNMCAKICNNKTDVFTMDANNLLQNEGCKDKINEKEIIKTNLNESLNLIDLINSLNNELLKKQKEKKNNDKNDLMKKVFKKVIIPGSFFENNNFCPIFMNLLKLDIYNACSKNGINISQKLTSLFKAINNFYETLSELDIETEKQIQNEIIHNDIKGNEEKIKMMPQNSKITKEIEINEKNKNNTTNSYNKDLNFFKNQSSLYKLSQYCIENHVLANEMVETFDTIYIYTEKNNNNYRSNNILNDKFGSNQNLEFTLNISKKNIEELQYIENRNSVLLNEECSELKNNKKIINNGDIIEDDVGKENEQQIYNTCEKKNISDKEVYEISSSFDETEKVTLRENKMCNINNEQKERDQLFEMCGKLGQNDDTDEKNERDQLFEMCGKLGQNDNINEYKDRENILKCEKNKKNISIYNENLLKTEKMQDNEYDQIHINKRKLEQTYLFKEQDNDDNNTNIRIMEEEQNYKKKNKIENNDLIKCDILKNDFFKNSDEYNNIVTPCIHHENINEKGDYMIPYNIETGSILSSDKNEENRKALSCKDLKLNKENDKPHLKKIDNFSPPENVCNISFHDIESRSFLSCNDDNKISEIEMEEANSDIIILDAYDETQLDNTNVKGNKKGNLNNQENDKTSQNNTPFINNYHKINKVNKYDLDIWFNTSTPECPNSYNEDKSKEKNPRNLKQSDISTVANMSTVANVSNKESENEVSILNIDLNKAHDTVLEGLMNFFGLKSKRLPRKILITELKKIQTYLCKEYNTYLKKNNLIPNEDIYVNVNCENFGNDRNEFVKEYENKIFDTNFENEFAKNVDKYIEDNNIKIESYIKLDELINNDKNKLQEEYINNMKNKIKIMEMKEIHERIDEAINVNENINNIIQSQKKIKYSILKKYLIDCKLTVTKDTIVSYCKNRNIEILFKRAGETSPT